MTTAASSPLGRGEETAVAGVPTEPWPSRFTSMTVPAHRDFVASIRAIARSSAVLADLSLDDVEELQIAVDEAATLLLPLVDPDAKWLTARFDIERGAVTIGLSLHCRAGQTLDRSGLAWLMLTAIDPNLVVLEDGGVVTVTISHARSDATT